MTVSSKSPLRNMAEYLREQWRAVRGGTYFVKRGPILWADFDFEAQPRAVAILIDDHTFLRDINDANVAFELGARMPSGREPEVDDGLLEELTDDAKWVIRQLVKGTDSVGDAVVLRLEHQSARIREWHDPDMKVQGVICTFLAAL